MKKNYFLLCVILLFSISLFACADVNANSAAVRINEITAKSDAGRDWIELYNAGNTAVDISQWIISDNNKDHQYRIPDGTLLQPRDYLVIGRDDSGTSGFDFGLGAQDAVRLYDARENLIDSTSWEEGDAPNNQSWGRIPNGLGDFETLTTPTRGRENMILNAGFVPGMYADGSDALFDMERIIEVVIEMDPADWEFVKNDRREVAVGTDTDELFATGYTYKPATVTIDGMVFENVGVRKKGFVGSVNNIKPSLKIKLDRFEPGQELFGFERITLNNNTSDPSFLNQYFTYALFRRANLPAPRCNLAVVTVNGEFMGLYSNVESIKKNFLSYHFSDNDGDLYELYGSDFQEEWINSFEVKTGVTDRARTHLYAVAEALTLPDDELMNVLPTLVDMEAFYRFWAMEVLLKHGDGYTSDGNNTYVYVNPENGKLYFIPWGTDKTMLDFYEVNLFAQAILPNRLYNIPSERAKYYEAMQYILDEVWDEDWLNAEIDRLIPIIEPYFADDPYDEYYLSFDDAVNNLRSFVDNRRSKMEKVIADPPEWDGFDKGGETEKTEDGGQKEDVGGGECAEGEDFKKDGVTYTCKGGQWNSEENGDEK